MTTTDSRFSPTPLLVMVTAGGAAALSWEIIWQIKAAHALGVSALGTAITLATLMGGMAAGSLSMGRWLRDRDVQRPLRLYGLMELVVGASGILLGPAFLLLEQLDSSLYRLWPAAAPAWHLLGIAAVLAPPTLAMGATVPVFSVFASRTRLSISMLYGWNTAGAAVGVLAMAFMAVPALGIFWSSVLIASVNLLVAVTACCLREPSARPLDAPPEPPATGAVSATPGISFPAASLLVFVTGLATFGLEVAWFRSLRAAYFSTTYSFAIMLAAVLVPLALAARKVPHLKERNWPLGTILAGAGVAVLLATPLVERFDLFRNYFVFFIVPSWFVQTLLVIGPAIFLLGVALPWLLDSQQTARDCARLYAVNTFGAIVGSLLAAWCLLPALGFARTAWAMGLLILAVALPFCPFRSRWSMAAAGLGALAVAVGLESGVGRDRTLGPKAQYTLVAFAEEPDSTISVVEMKGRRHLYIDGFSASDETNAAAYMAWMGRLPILLHENPQDGLVICFGTGQTAHAARLEDPRRLDIVDINRSVFEFADQFPSNGGVLDDPRTRAIVMDGRAWLRRTDARYDFITLEPMPPTFAGVNALYSEEFYRLAARRLRPGGMAAQWLPFHLVDRRQAASIAATFQAVFPDCLLWIDPVTTTGILVGRRSHHGPPLSRDWPGLKRDRPGRSLTAERIRAAVALDARGLSEFSATGQLITDDNQLLAYNWSIHPLLADYQQLARENLARIEVIAAEQPTVARKQQATSSPLRAGLLRTLSPRGD